MKNFFKTFINILNSNNITYFIKAGTLLGAIRDNGIAPWDDDLDIGFLYKDFIKLIELKDYFFQKYNIILLNDTAANSKKNRLFRAYPMLGKKLPKPYEFNFPYIDVCVLYKEQDRLTFMSEMDKFFFEKEVFPLKLYQFEDIYVKGPGNPMSYLDRRYPNWRTCGVTGGHSFFKSIPKYNLSISYYNRPFLWIWKETKTKIKNIEAKKLLFSKDYEIIIINLDNLKYYLPEIVKFSKYINKYLLKYILIFTLAYKYGGLFINSKLKLINDFSNVLKISRGYEYISFNCFSNNFKCNKDPTSLVFVVKAYSYLVENILKRIKQQLTMNSHFNIDLIIKEEINSLFKENNYKYFLIDKNSNFSNYFLLS